MDQLRNPKPVPLCYWGNKPDKKLKPPAFMEVSEVCIKPVVSSWLAWCMNRADILSPLKRIHGIEFFGKFGKHMYTWIIENQNMFATVLEISPSMVCGVVLWKGSSLIFLEDSCKCMHNCHMATFSATVPTQPPLSQAAGLPSYETCKRSTRLIQNKNYLSRIVTLDCGVPSVRITPFKPLKLVKVDQRWALFLCQDYGQASYCHLLSD